ncbi:hypothetical protein [Streptomyces albicerus]|nr:hypothetical protein [Streptomyces albicerus]
MPSTALGPTAEAGDDNCPTRKGKAAGDQIAECVSRARSARLVLEL